MLIVSIDVGILNLAIVLLRSDPASWTDENRKPTLEVLEAWHLDITEMTHESVPEHECQLYHTKELSDRVVHVIQEYEPKWTAHGPIDHYLIEQQPLGGLTGIEMIFFQRFRDRITRISPNAMHAFFKLSDDYETRKIQVVQLATPFLRGHKHFDTHERKHDCADATCLAAFQIYQWVAAAREANVARELQDRFEENIRKRHSMNADAWFETFRYRPEEWEPSEITK
jgi:hypothetical protein